MKLSSGWIKLYRQLQDCWIWLDKEPFDKRSAWVDLLLTANHSDKKILFNGELITIKRGQILTSVRKLSVKWKWSVNKVYRFLKLLEDDEMLQKESDKDRTLLTIVNYSIFQCCEYTNGNSNGNIDEYTSDTPSETPTNTPTEHKQECKEYKNDKNVKNEKKEKKEVTNVTKKKEPVVYYPNDDLLDNAFSEYVTMRDKIKKPITTKQCLTRAMNTLDRLSGGDNNLAIKILNQSVDHCWQGLFALKDDSNHAGASLNKVAIDWSSV